MKDFVDNENVGEDEDDVHYYFRKCDELLEVGSSRDIRMWDGFGLDLEYYSKGNDVGEGCRKIHVLRRNPQEKLKWRL
jgi:hypothetical protein